MIGVSKQRTNISTVPEEFIRSPDFVTPAPTAAQVVSFAPMMTGIFLDKPRIRAVVSMSSPAMEVEDRGFRVRLNY
jgi:hypothetical protein